MKNEDNLRELGWSDELIEAFKAVSKDQPNQLVNELTGIEIRGAGEVSTQKLEIYSVASSANSTILSK